MPLKDDPRIVKGIARLRAMGLKVAFEEIEEDRWGVLAVDITSIVSYIKRKLNESVRYPNMFVYVDFDNRIIEIHVWRGGTPEKVRELMQIAREKEELYEELSRIRGETE